MGLWERESLRVAPACHPATAWSRAVRRGASRHLIKAEAEPLLGDLSFYSFSKMSICELPAVAPGACLGCRRELLQCQGGRRCQGQDTRVHASEGLALWAGLALMTMSPRTPRSPGRRSTVRSLFTSSDTSAETSPARAQASGDSTACPAQLWPLPPPRALG